MKKAGIVIAIVLTLSLATGATVYASQGSVPGDTLYPVKLAAERVGMALPANDESRAERALNFAQKRVREMVRLAEMQRWGALDPVVGRYECALNATRERIQRAPAGQGTATMTRLTAEAMVRHLSVLIELYDSTAQDARPPMLRAMERCCLCYGWTVQVLRQKGAEVPAVPEQIRERIREILGRDI